MIEASKEEFINHGRLVVKSPVNNRLLTKIAQELENGKDIYYLPKEEFEVEERPSREDARASIKSQIYLLKFSGFKNFQVGFAHLKDWRNPANPQKVHSIIIKARK